MNLPPNITLSGNLDTNKIVRCNLHDVPFPCPKCVKEHAKKKLKFEKKQ